MVDGSEPCGSSQNGFFGMADDGSYATGLNWYGCASTSAWTYNAATNTSVALPIMESVPGEGGARGNDVNSHGARRRLEQDALAAAGAAPSGLTASAPSSTAWAPSSRMICVDSGDYCCSTVATDPRCPEYVDDASCNNGGFCDLAGIECLAGICTGGVNAGLTCSGYWNCPGSCTQGATSAPTAPPTTPAPAPARAARTRRSCTSDYSCPDTVVCVG